MRLLPVLVLALAGCRSNYDQVNVPAPGMHEGIRVNVHGVERGPFTRFLAVHGEAVNETGAALRSCELRFVGLDFSGERLGVATAKREAWPAGQLWKFRAAFPSGGVQELYDVGFEGVTPEPAR